MCPMQHILFISVCFHSSTSQGTRLFDIIFLKGRCWKSVYYIKVLQSYKKAIPTLTLCAKNHLYPIIFCVEPAGKFQFSSPCVSDRPTCLTFFCSKMSKNAQWINKDIVFSSVKLRCSLTSRMQRYNMHTPKSKFFRNLISHPDFFLPRKTSLSPLFTGISKHFSRTKKMK